MDTLDKIKNLRDKRSWSNYRLAKETGISEGTLNNMFRRNNLPTIPTLETICSGFGITLSQFFVEGKEAVELDDAQQEMLSHWIMLTKNQQVALLQLMKNM